MKLQPQKGETWFVDLGMVEKPRWAYVLANPGNGRLAIASVVLITTQYGGTPYEITLPRVPWLREQSYVNAQSLQPVKLIEFLRPAPGKFDARILTDIQAVVKRWLSL